MGEDAVNCAVELIWLSIEDGTLRFRSQRAPLRARVHPDDAARIRSGLTLCRPGAVLHSTSWRYDRQTIVLTYVALPDPAPCSTRPVPLDRMAVGGAPLAPSPVKVEEESVAAHAVRYLAQLVERDGVVAAAATEQPALWELVRKAHG